MPSRRSYIFVSVALAVSAFVVKTVVDAGVLRQIQSVSLPSCHMIIGVAGAEDIKIDSRRELAFISSDDRRANAGTHNVNGKIYIYDIKERRLIDKMQTFDFPFHPHGISVLPDDKEVKIFVINHRNDHEHTIEEFNYNGRDLVHYKTIRGEWLRNPNGIVALDQDRLIVTNDQFGQEKLIKKAESYLRLPTGNLIYYVNGTVYRLSSALVYANGVVINKRKKKIYVAEMVQRRLVVFSWERGLNDIRRIGEYDMEGGPDNITEFGENELIVAVHPNLLRLAAAQKSAENLSPSQLYRIELDTDGMPARSHLIYSNDGTELSNASVGIEHLNHLMIGTIFDNRVLHCKLNFI